MNDSSLHPLQRVLFAGGGSGGHLYPALAVADELSRRSPMEIRFASTSRPVEDQIFQSSPYRRHVIPSVSSPDLKRNPVTGSWKFLQGLRQARRLLLEFRPQVVVGCGGFGSLPTVIAAHLQRIPILLLEQNVVPGLTTTMLARQASKICVPCEEISSLTKWRQKLVVAGNPVRQEISQLATRSIDAVLANRLILVMGGSQGSWKLNEAVVQAFAQGGLPSGWHLTHITGTTDQPRILQAYEQAGIDAEVLPFAQHIPALYEQAGIVICRAGALTLAEVACAGVPTIMIPLPNSARDHQHANARWFEDRGGAIVLAENDDELSSKLIDNVNLLTTGGDHRERLAAAIHRLARPNATRLIAEEIEKLGYLG